MVNSQELSDQLYTSVSKIVKKHGSTVDVSVIIKAFDILTNKVNHVNSVLQQGVDTWEECLTVDETDNAADKKYFNLDVEQNMCPSVLRKNSCGNELITEVVVVIILIMTCYTSQKHHIYYLVERVILRRVP